MTGSQRFALRPIRIDLWFPVLVVGAVLFLSALGISGSSLPVFSSSGKPDDSAVVAGRLRNIRSDEWLAWSPMKTGRVRADFPTTQTYGMGSVDLSDSWRPQLPSRSIGAALYSPYNLPLVALPLEQGFALMWWLPFVACSLGVYAWLRAMRVSSGVALAASLLATTAPAAVWWSGWMCQILGTATLACAVLVAATRVFARSRPWAIAAALGAALVAANLPWFYQPWALPIAVFVGGVTLLWGIGGEHRRAFLVLAGVAAVMFAVEQGVYLLHERSYYEALQATVYPGDRRYDGGGVGIGHLFSSLFPVVLAGDHANGIVSSNLSEISMGWSVLAPLVATAGVLGCRTLWRDRDRVLVVGTLALSALLTSWCFVRWPSILASLTGITLVPPTRIAPLVGFFWLIGFALLFGSAERRTALVRDLGLRGAVIVVVVTTGFAAWGAARFRSDFLPGLSDARTWLPVVAVAVVVTVLWTRYWAVALTAAVVAAVVSGALVNPITDGLGSIDDARAAQVVRRLDDHMVDTGGGRWAGDGLYVNGLINGQGVDSLSSFNDPVDEDGWRVLDPSGRQEDVWNRFAYIMFQWEPGLGAPVIEAPSPDQLVVRVDPCDDKLTRLRLRAIVSLQPLDATCLTERATFRWMGSRYSVYARR